MNPAIGRALAIGVGTLMSIVCLLGMIWFLEADGCYDAGGIMVDGICEGAGHEYNSLLEREGLFWFWGILVGISLLAGYCTCRFLSAILRVNAL